VRSIDGNLYVTTSKERLDKCKDFVKWWHVEAGKDSEAGLFAHKKLERERGHLVYLCRAYPAITPFLKGVHHTLDSWRPGRDQDGWKFNSAEWKAFL